MTNVVSNLWFAKEAREAVDFYISLVPNSASPACLQKARADRPAA
jgi:predicted 3-demethylubiquinone-9 3-methyltransferase (glyoxalase superfamily)